MGLWLLWCVGERGIGPVDVCCVLCLVYCDVTEQQCLTAAVCVTPPASCFFVSCSEVLTRGVLVRGRTSRLPGHNELRYIPGEVAPPPPRKVKATMNCRAPVVCLVTVHVSCLDTAAVPAL